MKNQKILMGGYIGLLMLLIGVALIIFFIMRTDLFLGKKNKKNIIEQNQDYINQAKEAKNLIEQKSQKTAEEQERF